jgi:hypothetical protein
MKIDRRQIEKEAEEHISLGLLLRKRRSPGRRQEVERIMAGPQSVGQKIERIRRLDAEPEAAEAETAEPDAEARGAGPDAEQAGPEPVGRTQPARGAERGRQSARRIKSSPPAASFWAFMFRELPRLRAFGRRTHTLLASWLPPTVRADPALKGFLTQTLQPWAAELTQRLKPVLELGWLHLTKRQYNWIAALARLAERILAADFAHLRWRDRNLIDSLRALEAQFLLLHSREDVLPQLTASLRTVFDKKARLEDYRPTADLVHRLLSAEVSLPSLYNCLLAFNMVKFRRLLGLADLLRGGPGEAVSASEFDCPPEIRARIAEYVASSLENLQTLHSQLAELRRLAGYLAYDEQGQADTRLLAALYGPRLEADRGNLMVLVPRLFTAFERTFQPLLAGSVAVEGLPKATLFEPAFFQTEFARLATVTEKLEKAVFGFANFPFNRFLSIRASSQGAIPKELEVLRLVEEGLAVLFNLGKVLARVLAMDGVGARDGEAVRPLDTSLLQGQPFVLPHAGRRLQGGGFLRGLTVREGLEQVVRICFTTGHLLQDPAVFLHFGKEPRLAAQLSATLRQLEHLLDEKTYTELKLRYA